MLRTTLVGWRQKWKLVLGVLSPAPPTPPASRDAPALTPKGAAFDPTFPGRDALTELAVAASSTLIGRDNDLLIRVEQALVTLAGYVEGLDQRLGELETHVHTLAETRTGLAEVDELAQLRANQRIMQHKVDALRTVVASAPTRPTAALPLAPPGPPRPGPDRHVPIEPPADVDLNDLVALLPEGIFQPARRRRTP